MFVRMMICAIATFTLPTVALAASAQQDADAAERVVRKVHQTVAFYDAFEHLMVPAPACPKQGCLPVQPKAKTVHELFEEAFPLQSKTRRIAAAK